MPYKKCEKEDHSLSKKPQPSKGRLETAASKQGFEQAAKEDHPQTQTQHIESDQPANVPHEQTIPPPWTKDLQQGLEGISENGLLWQRIATSTPQTCGNVDGHLSHLFASLKRSKTLLLKHDHPSDEEQQHLETITRATVNTLSKRTPATQQQRRFRR